MISYLFFYDEILYFLMDAGYEADYIFDWTILKYQEAEKMKPRPESQAQDIFSVSVLLCFEFLCLIKIIHCIMNINYLTLMLFLKRFHLQFLF